MKKGIFSGRFDPPNLGHVLTLQKLLQEYSFILVPILDYPERSGCSAADAKRIFEYHFDQVLPRFSAPRITFIVNSTHFGRIRGDEFYTLCVAHGLDMAEVTYLTGNKDVLTHVQSIHSYTCLRVRCEEVPRVAIPDLDPYLFESTKLRKEMVETGKTLPDLYNITARC